MTEQNTVVEVTKVKVKDILDELKRTGETYTYTAQGYYLPPINEFNTKEINGEEVTKASFALPNRDEGTIMYLNPFTRAHTQFSKFLEENEETEGGLKNREFIFTFRARLSANEKSKKKNLYVLEAKIQVTDKVFEVVGFPENAPERDDGGYDDSTFSKPAPKGNPQMGLEPRVTAGTQKKLLAIMQAGGLAIPPALSDGTMLEKTAKNLLIQLIDTE